jgi:hypothetical protein
MDRKRGKEAPDLPRVKFMPLEPFRFSSLKETNSPLLSHSQQLDVLHNAKLAVDRFKDKT